MSNNDLAIRFFLQLAFIVATCRIVGLLESESETRRKRSASA